MHLFKHYSEEHNPNCTRLYWKTDKVQILDVLYNKLNVYQLSKLMTICREKHNPNHGNWSDKPNRTPVMVRTAGVEFFATLNTLKKAYYALQGLKYNPTLDYYNNCIFKKHLMAPKELKPYYDNIWDKIFRARYYNETLTEKDIKEIESIINE